MNIIFLQFQPPGLSSQFLGFVLIDRTRRRQCTRCRSSWEPSIDPMDADVASGTPEVIQALFEQFDFEVAVSKVWRCPARSGQRTNCISRPRGIPRRWPISLRPTSELTVRWELTPARVAMGGTIAALQLAEPWCLVLWIHDPRDQALRSALRAEKEIGHRP